MSISIVSISAECQLRFPDNHPALCGPSVGSLPCRLPRPTPTQSDQAQISDSEDMIELSTLTTEQLAVVNTELEAGEVRKVEAFAGTGKTRCLRAWAQQNPQYDILRLSVSAIQAKESLSSTRPQGGLGAGKSSGRPPRVYMRGQAIEQLSPQHPPPPLGARK